MGAERGLQLGSRAGPDHPGCALRDGQNHNRSRRTHKPDRAVRDRRVRTHTGARPKSPGLKLPSPTPHIFPPPPPGRSLNTNWPQQQLPAGSPVPIVAVPDRQQKFTRDDLRTLMWDRVGLARDSAGLAAAITALAHWQAPEPTDRQSAEDRNLLDLARLTVVAARARTHSLGAHYRVDGPDTATTEPTTSPTPTTTRKAA